jgi:hypothetical protein
MSDLGIENSVTMDLKLADECTRIFDEVMEYFNDSWIFEHLFQTFRETFKLSQIEEEAVIAYSNLLNSPY